MPEPRREKQNTCYEKSSMDFNITVPVNAKETFVNEVNKYSDAII